MRARIPLALAAALIAAPAAAHDFWVQPERFQVTPQEPMPITLQVGHGAQRQRSPIPAARIVRFAAMAPDGQAIDLRAGLHPGNDADDGKIQLPGAGTYAVVLETDNRAQSHLPGPRFNDYLEDEGLTPAAESRRRSGREAAEGSERYSRVAKALVRVGDGGPAGATWPLGLPLEIVPLADPYGADATASLPILVLYQGRPLAGALVKLTDLAHDAVPVEVHRTDAAGRAMFQTSQRGDWLLNVIWTRPLPAADEVDFETTFSSLSFGFPQAAPSASGR